MKRRLRILGFMAAFSSAGILLQGTCIANGINIGLAGLDFCALLGPNCTLGPIAPCGDPTTSEDDLLIDCPAPVDP